MNDINFTDIKNCISDIEFAISGIETELSFMKRHLINLNFLIQDGQGRNE